MVVADRGLALVHLRNTESFTEAVDLGTLHLQLPLLLVQGAFESQRCSGERRLRGDHMVRVSHAQRSSF